MVFRNSRWHLYIEDQASLKSITCLLLDQSLDLGINNNPLMFDSTLSEHFTTHKHLITNKHQNSDMDLMRKFSTNAMKSKRASVSFQCPSLVIDAESSSAIVDSIDTAPPISHHLTINKSDDAKKIIAQRLNMSAAYVHAKEFEHLQSFLVCFPEEAAFLLANVEYELFNSVHPTDYLRHVALDNSVKIMMSPSIATAPLKLKSTTVQDLIIRYKEVNCFY